MLNTTEATDVVCYITVKIWIKSYGTLHRVGQKIVDCPIPIRDIVQVSLTRSYCRIGTGQVGTRFWATLYVHHVYYIIRTQRLGLLVYFKS